MVSETNAKAPFVPAVAIAGDVEKPSPHIRIYSIEYPNKSLKLGGMKYELFPRISTPNYFTGNMKNSRHITN